jgi:hypothetical protein
LVPLAVVVAFAFLPGSASGAPSNGGHFWKYTGSTPGSGNVFEFRYQDSASSLQDFELQVTGSSPSTYQWTSLAVTVNGTPVPDACLPLTGAVGGISCQFASGAVNDGAEIALSSDATPAIPVDAHGVLFVQDWLSEGTSIKTDGPAIPYSALRRGVRRAESAEHSVRYVTVGSGSGPRVRLLGDVARDRSIQRFTASGGGKTGHATVIVIHSTAYVRGDAYALRQWSFPASFISRYAGEWVSIPHGNSLYTSVAVKFGALATRDVPGGLLSVVSGTVRGKPMWGLQGKESGGIATTYVPYNKQPPLPVEDLEVWRGTYPYTERVTFMHWNEAVHVKAPAHAVRIH